MLRDYCKREMFDILQRRTVNKSLWDEIYRQLMDNKSETAKSNMYHHKLTHEVYYKRCHPTYFQWYVYTFRESQRHDSVASMSSEQSSVIKLQCLIFLTVLSYNV